MKSVFEMTPEELAAQLKPAADAAKAKRFAAGLPANYRDARCPTEWHFIHEYENGSQFLVLLIEGTLQHEVIKQLK